jgi:hypothetical protein
MEGKNIRKTREYWKEEEEKILREWADKAQCYEIMNTKSHEIYKARNTLFVIPVIIISTITGTANFAQDRVPAQYVSTFVMVVGAFNIMAGIITTISQYLKVAELNESYRVGALQWGKFYRNIKTELIKHPLDRMEPSSMLSMCKEEFDRLMEIYPIIPQKVIRDFNNKFKNNTEIAKPEICDIMEATPVFKMSEDERKEMIRMLTEPELKEEDQPNENTEDNTIDSSDVKSEIDPEVAIRVDKFKQTFYKINGRYPNDDELKETMSAFLNDMKIEITTVNGSDEEEV